MYYRGAEAVVVVYKIQSMVSVDHLVFLGYTEFLYHQTFSLAGII